MTLVYVRNGREAPVIVLDNDAIVVDLLDIPSHSTVTTNLVELIQSVGYAQQETMDMTLLAIAVYLADKQVPRKHASDGWQRCFELHLPVGNLEVWTLAKSTIEAALDFLTGDVWHLTVRAGQNILTAVTPPLLPSLRTNAVCLFSGGLDSFVGAIDLLENRQNMLLVGHWDATAIATAQERMHGHLQDVYPEQTDCLSIRVTPRRRSRKQPYPLPNQSRYETTTRSRSFLFIALGLLAANALGPHVPLYVPENGFISLNVPWNWSRYGSCSTRSTHPHFLRLIRETLEVLGITNHIHNPYQFKTKGMMLKECKNNKLLSRAAPDTLSCSHPTVGRWKRLPVKNCGYCLPCIIRRASLHAIDQDNPSDYLYDFARDTSLIRHENKGATARAVLWGLSSSSSLLPRLLANGPLMGATGEIIQAKHVYTQGIAEIVRLLKDKASQEILDFANLER